MRHMLSVDRRVAIVFSMFISRLKSRVSAALISHDSVRFSLINALLERHFSQVVEAVDVNRLLESRFQQVLEVLIRNHGKELLENVLAHRSKEALETLARTNASAMISTLCRDHLQEVIIEVVARGEGAFRYVGNGKIKVIVGAASQRLPGWLATDISLLNITQDSSWSILFNPATIDNILAEHVLEHLSLEELYRTLANAKKYLKVGGILRVAVPDAFHPSRYYYNLVKPGGWETPAEHKLFFDHEMLTRVAQESGFQVRLLEYFDEQGIFHRADYSIDDGAIQRCAANNCGLDTANEDVMKQFYETIPDHLRRQFHDRGFTYTSLIADLIS
jgi:predicted SAM-dependent methyltransferase